MPVIRNPLFKATCGMVFGKNYFWAMHALPPGVELVIGEEQVLVNYTKSYNKFKFSVGDISDLSELHTFGRHGILLNHSIEKYPKYIYLFFVGHRDLNAAKRAFWEVGIPMRPKDYKHPAT